MDHQISKLVKRGHDAASELKASCGSVDVLAVAQLLSDLATQLDVNRVALTQSRREFTAANATIHNLELKVAAVVAENSSVKAMNDCLSEELRSYESDGAFEGPKMHLLWWKCETPATDAYLAEVRAQGVDAAIEQLHKKFEGTGHIGVPVMVLESFAAQLRQGAEHE